MLLLLYTTYNISQWDKNKPFGETKAKKHFWRNITIILSNRKREREIIKRLIINKESEK